MASQVRNRQIMLKDFVVSGYPVESDFVLHTDTISLKLSEGSSNAILVRNLYLSCDPFMRLLMVGPTVGSDPGFPLYKLLSGGILTRGGILQSSLGVGTLVCDVVLI